MIGRVNVLLLEVHAKCCICDILTIPVLLVTYKLRLHSPERPEGMSKWLT